MAVLTEKGIYKAVLRALVDYDKAKRRVQNLRESLRESCGDGDAMEGMSQELAKAEKDLARLGMK